MPGEDGIEIELDSASLSDATLSSLIAAMRLVTTRLTLRRLRSGKRYRFLSDFRGLRAGEIIVYRGFNDIDNHYGEHEFTGEDGRDVKLGGDCSNRLSDPLAEVHRLLTPLDE